MFGLLTKKRQPKHLIPAKEFTVVDETGVMIFNNRDWSSEIYYDDWVARRYAKLLKKYKEYVTSLKDYKIG